MESNYRDWPAISQSELKDLAKSPRYYEAKHVLKTIQSESTRSQEIGTLVHAAILEDNKLWNLMAIPPREVLASNGHRRGGAYDNWKALQNGKIIITEDELQMIDSIVVQARKHPVLQMFLANKLQIEMPILWEDALSGLRCKGIPDLVCKTSYVVDVKTCQNVDDIERSVATYGYHLQAAFYLRGCSAHYGNIYDNFVILAVETNPPYRVHARLLDEQAIMVGNMRIDELLADYARRKEANDWSEAAEKEITVLSLPKWAV